MVDGLPVGVFEADRAVGHDTLTLRAANGGTEIGFGTHAKDTIGLGALGRVARNNVIARRDRRDAVFCRMHKEEEEKYRTKTRQTLRGVRRVRSLLKRPHINVKRTTRTITNNLHYTIKRTPRQPIRPHNRLRGRECKETNLPDRGRRGCKCPCDTKRWQ
jgi:hypothetical protein